MNTPENSEPGQPLAVPLSDQLGVWQPIDTAPKDGTQVLVLLDSAGVAVVHIAWYRSREEWESSGQYCGGWETLAEWEGWWSYTRTSVSQERLDGFAEPTHWHPIPSHREALNDQGRPAVEAAAQRVGCSECRFAGSREGYDSYTCRRHAPIAAHDQNKHCGVYQDAFVPRWPLMSGRDWCGDFERA